jgi:hypothetical protein
VYGEHIEEMYNLFRENTPKSKIKAKNVAEEVIGILYAQGEIDDARLTTGVHRGSHRERQVHL